MKFDKNTPASIGERIQSNFSSGYLTLISIIQGVAFGILVSGLKPIFEVGAWSGLVLPILSLISLSFMVFYYHWFVSILYSPPNIFETLIPIIVSIFEVIPFYYFNNHKIWWLTTGIFYLIAILAFCLTLINISKNSFEPDNKSIKRFCYGETIGNIFALLICSIICFSCYLKYPNEGKIKYSIENHELKYMVLLGFVAFIMAFKTHTIFLKKIFNYTNLRHEK